MVNKTPITGRVYVPDVLPFLSLINSPSPSTPIKIYPPIEIKEHFYREDILWTPVKKHGMTGKQNRVIHEGGFEGTYQNLSR
jgi:hypothetical protein